MRTVDIGVGHDNDFVVSTLIDILIHSNTCSNRLDHALDFFVRQNFILAALESVNDLTAQWQNGLCISESPTLSATTCRITFDQVQLALFHLVADTIAQLTWQTTTTQSIFSFT